MSNCESDNLSINSTAQKLTVWAPCYLCRIVKITFLIKKSDVSLKCRYAYFPVIQFVCLLRRLVKLQVKNLLFDPQKKKALVRCDF